MAGVFSQEESGVVKVSSAPPKAGDGLGLVTVAGSGDMGSHVGELETHLEGKQLSIGFNVPYLTAALSHLESEKVTLQVTTSTAPMVIRPVGEDVGEYIHILTPLQLLDEQVEN